MTDITFATTCMGRLAHLQQSLPSMVAQPGCHVVVVDYSCPDHCGDWIEQHYSPDQVTVVRIADRSLFDRAEAKNAAITAAPTDWVCLVDADVVLADGFAEQVRPLLTPGYYLKCAGQPPEGLSGTFIAAREALQRSGMHDPVFQGWGEEDNDLQDALRFIGQQPATFPVGLITHLEHDDTLRLHFHETTDRRVSWIANVLYRVMKWDVAHINGKVPTLESRRDLYRRIQSKVTEAIEQKSSAEITLPMGQKRWGHLNASVARTLTFRVDIDPDF